MILLRGGSPLQKVRNEVADVLKIRSLVKGEDRVQMSWKLVSVRSKHRG